MADEVDAAPPREPAPADVLPPGDAFLGRVLAGRIRVIRAIARGGMGKVYYGEQLALSRPCAIKVLDKNLAGDESGEFNKRFLLEASISAKLSHPNVVKIFDYGETDDGVVWLAMEYLEGQTLAQALERGPLEPGRAIHIAVQVARALREAHALGVVHRDMKPANVFLSRSDDDGDFAKVLDFGLVKVASASGDDANLTEVGQIMGSPKYMAPEQTQGHDVDARADVYSLGATLFAMLTGKAPFERANAMATMMAHLADPVPHLSDLALGFEVPPGLDEILQRCLAKDRDDRYASMEELLLSLRSYRGPGVAMLSGSGPTVTGSQVALSGANISLVDASKPASQAGSFSRLPLLVLAGTVVAGTLGIVILNRVLEPARVSVRVESQPIPTAVAAPAPSASAPPRVLDTVLEVVTEPPGARVKEDGLEVCASTPCSVTFRGEAAGAKVEHLLEILKPDFRLEKKLVASTAGRITVKLTRAK